MAIIQRKDGRWAVYYRVRDDDGKSRVKWESFGRGPVEQARAEARDAELGLQRRRPRREHGGPLFSELAHAYAEARHFSPNSRRHLNIRLEANILPHFGELPAMAIGHDQVEAYVTSRREAKQPRRKIRGVSWATIRRELTDLKAILSWAARRRPALIPANPIRDYVPPQARDTAIIDPPTGKELAAIIKHAEPHLVRAIMLSYHLGLRPGPVELFSLAWSDVSWDSMTITVRSAHKGGPLRRMVPIHESLAKSLRDWEAADRKEKIPWIVHYYGRPIKCIHRAWWAALAKAKIRRRLRMYDLRHLFVTTALERGGDIHGVADVVGSKPDTIWRHYQHVTRQLHRQTVDLIPEMEPPAVARADRRRKKA